ncbi:cytochrome b [Tsuneonella sp. HG222]
MSIALHWSIAAAIAVLYGLGWWMTDAVHDPERVIAAFAGYQVHKSLGLTVLVLSLVQLAWHFAHRRPALPARMTRLERLLAKSMHGLLFALMIMLPLSGWLYVSAGWDVRGGAPLAIPTFWFGAFEWPHIPAIADLETPARAAVAQAALRAHDWLGWVGLVLIAGHALAALHHHFHVRDAVLWQMLPIGRRPELGDGS